MKFCSNCGTQMPDESKLCPQCQAPVFNQYQTPVAPTKKKVDKMYFIVPLIIVITAFVAFAAAYFALLPNNETQNRPDTDEGYGITSEDDTEDDIEDDDAGVRFNAETDKNVCPADDYGNHDWRAPTCLEPAQCYNCGAYKDDKLGNHNFYYDEDIDATVCWDCNYIKEEE